MFYVIAVLMGLSLFAPIVALGNNDLVAGDTATLSTGGGDATVRESASAAAESVGSIPNGTEVYIVEGPVSDTDGSLWYQAGVWNITGYISSTVLEGMDDSTPAADEAAETTETESTTPTLPWLEPIDFGVVVDDSNAPLPGDGLACRVDASGAAETIVRLSMGQSLEVTGPEEWSEGVEFLPVNCSGQGGFVKADYVALNSEPEVEEVVEEIEEPIVAEEPVAAEEETSEDVAAEEAVADEPVAGDLIVRVSDQDGLAVPGLCFQLVVDGAVVADACDSNDALPNNGNNGFFGITSGNYTLVASSTPDGMAIDDRAVSIVPGDTGNLAITVTTLTAPEEPVVAEEAAAEEAAAEEAAAEEAAAAEERVASEEMIEDTEDVEVAAITADPAAAEEMNEAGDAVVTDEPAAAEELDLSPTIGDATVTGTNGEGVRCLVGPDAESATIMVLEEGATVFVLEGPVDGYLGVACGEQLGYVDINYMLAYGAGEEIPASAGSVVIVDTGGMSLNCRSGAGSGFSVLTSVPQGSVLTSRGASSNGWAPVVCNGMNGFVSIAYVEVSGGGTGTGTTSPGTGGSTSGTGTIANTGGAGLRCRTAPNGSIIMVLAEGTRVTTRGPESGGWVPVVCGGMNGFVSSQYITLGNGTTNPAPDTGSGSGSAVKSGDNGKVNVRANMRYSASLSANVVVVVDAGEVLRITGHATNGFYPVSYDGLNGFMATELLTKTSEALSERGGSAEEPDPQPSPGNGAGTATGNAIVNYAMRYVGYPYVWATAGPSSFDCSGFTNWVIKNVVGRDIGRGLWTQWASGVAVSRANLQPGDLVFFQNTYKAGLSHSGIYIGNNQFVHAENPNTGVRVSDLNSNYYGSRWLGARRIN